MKRLRWLAVVALLSFPLLWAQQPTHEAIRLPPISAESITVQGVATMAGQKFAAVSLAKNGSSWKKVGEGLGSLEIMEITDDAVRFVDRHTKAEFTRRLQDAPVKAADTVEPARYSKAWINSKANPMLLRYPGLPFDVAQNWGTMSEAQRDEIIAYYLNHGWRLSQIQIVNGLLQSMAIDNIYEQERREVCNENIRNFAASLDEKQKAVWVAINSNPPLRMADKPDRAKVEAEVTRRRAAMDQFLRTLSPEQRAKFDSRSDFTQHDWSR